MSSSTPTFGNADSRSVDGFDGVDADADNTICPQQPQPAANVGSTPIEKRALSRSNTFFDDPSDPRAILDDDLLEPCPHSPICDSMSEVLSGKSDLRRRARTAVTRSLDMAHQNSRALPEHIAATSFNGCPPLFPSPTFPPNKSLRSNLNIQHTESVAVKSTHPRLGSGPTLEARTAAACKLAACLGYV